MARPSTRKLRKLKRATANANFEREPPCLTGPTIVRIMFTDPNATDSDSSSDEREEKYNPRRGKKVILEVNIPGKSKKPRKKSGYIGVRQRLWGTWCSEIRHNGTRMWLGSFRTAKEAAIAYDKKAVELKGPKAVTNFPVMPAEEQPSKAGALKAALHPPSVTSASAEPLQKEE